MEKKKLLSFKLYFLFVTSNIIENYNQESCLFLKSLTLTKLCGLIIFLSFILLD